MQLIGVFSDIGASKRGSSKGVDLLMEHFRKNHNDLKQTRIINQALLQNLQNSPKYAKNIKAICEFFENKLIPEAKKVIESGEFPLIFSGDHSNALGILQAFEEIYYEEPIAVIWIDAHSDLHTPYDSNSGNIHGMPVGGILNIAKSGENCLEESEKSEWEKLCTLSTQRNIKPQNITYIGVRSLEKSEKDMIEKFKIPLYSVRQVRQNIQNVINEVITSLEKTHRVYLSVDVDVMDGKIFTSTGVRENNGLYPFELQECIELLIRGLEKKLIAIEFTEFNPVLDDSKTEDFQVLLKIISKTIEELEQIH
ncbi:arginase [Helicobacter sp. 13S00477-4]|nr:arginase [Helicobacter sp. 13S00477-4]